MTEERAFIRRCEEVGAGRGRVCSSSCASSRSSCTARLARPMKRTSPCLRARSSRISPLAGRGMRRLQDGSATTSSHGRSAGTTAAAAITEMTGGTPQQVEDAASLSLQAVIGMLYDPIRRALSAVPQPPAGGHLHGARVRRSGTRRAPRRAAAARGHRRGRRCRSQLAGGAPLHVARRLLMPHRPPGAAWPTIAAGSSTRLRRFAPPRGGPHLKIGRRAIPSESGHESPSQP